MIISLIAAMSENRIIGRNNKMPWKLPSDRKRFHEITRGHYTIMGRKTYESIGHPLPGRKNIILTRRRNYFVEGCVIAHDLGSAFAACGGTDEVFICGGGEVFQETISLADKIYLTIVHAVVEGDTLFPDIPPDFKEVEREEVPDAIPCAFVLFARKEGL
ncbi:MAG TPA: dihydrofolate reductase [Nitrospirota bacterium]|nr:dihydrofolate reductase [Nitrospirota bacterium]